MAAVVRNRSGAGSGTSVTAAIIRAAAYIALVVLAVSIIYPLVWMALNGFKSNAELFGDPWGLPSTWNPDSFIKAWNLGVVRYLLNSVIVTIASVVTTVLVSAMAAKAIRLRFMIPPVREPVRRPHEQRRPPVHRKIV